MKFTFLRTRAGRVGSIAAATAALVGLTLGGLSAAPILALAGQDTGATTTALAAGVARTANATTIGDDGLSVTVAQDQILKRTGASSPGFSVTVSDTNVSGASFDSYLISGVPASWTVQVNGSTLQPISSDPVLYRANSSAVQSSGIALIPAVGEVVSALKVDLSRETLSPNLVTDFDNGSFDYLGTAKPQLPAANSVYQWKDPTTHAPGMCNASGQYGPCDGQYSIWPTANMNGPAAGHFYNYWADLRSVSFPLSTPTAEVCQGWDTGSGGSPSLYTVPDADSAASGKFMVVNGSTSLPIPNNIVTTTITGLTPNTNYSFSGYLANLSDNIANNNVAPVRSVFFAGDQLIGTSEALPKQLSCLNDQTQWIEATSFVNTGDSTSLTLGVRNDAGGSFGNDLGIDELSLFPMATAQFNLSVNDFAPGLRVVKSANPVSGTTVARGSEVTYTVVANNTGDVALTGATITDNLADVLDDADFVSGSATASSGAAPVLNGSTLTWTGDLAVAGSVTLTYKVKVKTGPIAAATLLNTVTGSATDPQGGPVPSNCVTGSEVGCTTTHPVPALVPGLSVLKSADPKSGSTVAHGDIVTYTVVAANTGETALTGVTVTDDLSDVLDDAVVVAGSFAASSGAVPVVTGSTLLWSGDLAKGASVTLTYAVKVKTDSIAAVTLLNKVTGRGTVPGGPEVPSNCVSGVEVGCTTTHPVPALVPGLSVLKSADPVSGTQVARGDIVTYTVVAKNTGETALTAVTVTDNLADVFDDADFVLGSAAASSGVVPTVSGSMLTWVGDLAQGASVTLTYQVRVKTDFASAVTLVNAVTGKGVVPGVPGAPEVPSNCVTGVEVGCTTVHPVPASSVKIVKTDNKQVVGVGEALTYDVTVSNTGADVVTGVVVVDTLPVGVTYVSSTDGGVYDATARTVSWAVGSVAVGKDRVVHVVVTVDADVVPGQQIRNVATVDTDQGCVDDPATAVDECSTVDVDEVPSLMIVKDDHERVVAPGESLTYDVTVTNTGTVTIDKVVATDELPANLVFVSATAGGIFDAAKSVVSWDVGSLVAGASVTVQVTVRVADTVVPGDVIRNGAVVDSPQGCVDNPVTVADECHPIDVDNVPSVSVVKTDKKDVVVSGEVSTYELTVSNTGGYVAPSVVVTDVLPANLVFVSASDDGVYDAVSGVVTWAVGDLPVGAVKVVTVVVTVTATAPNEAVTNSARVTTDNTCVDDLSTDVNECESVDIDRLPAVSIVKDDGKTIVKPGELTTYTLTASNTSAYDAPFVVVRDVMPKNVDFIESSINGVQSLEDPYTFEWDLGTLPAGESRVVTVTVRVHAGLPAETLVVNTATVTTAGVCIDDPSTEVTECESVDIDRTPTDVWIVKDDHQKAVAPGEALTYDLTVGNNSAVLTVEDAVVSDVLPANLTFVSATAGGTYDAVTRTVTWKLGALAPGATVVVQVAVTVSASVVAGEEVINTATVDIPGGCLIAESCTTTDEDGVPNVTIVKDDHRTAVAAGATLTYDLTVSNKYDDAAKKVVVSDVLPGNLTFVSASDAGVFDAGTKTVTWALGTLDAGASRVIQVTVTVNAGVFGDVVNTATVTTEKGCFGAGCTSTDVDTLSNGLALTGTTPIIGVIGVLALLTLLLGAGIVAGRRRMAHTE